MILCTGGLDLIRKKAWSFYRTIPGVRLCWELEERKGPKIRVIKLERTGTRLISSGVAFKLNTIWPTKITTHRFYYSFYEPIV